MLPCSDLPDRNATSAARRGSNRRRPPDLDRLTLTARSCLPSIPHTAVSKSTGTLTTSPSRVSTPTPRYCSPTAIQACRRRHSTYSTRPPGCDATGRCHSICGTMVARSSTSCSNCSIYRYARSSDQAEGCRLPRPLLAYPRRLSGRSAPSVTKRDYGAISGAITRSGRWRTTEWELFAASAGTDEQSGAGFIRLSRRLPTGYGFRTALRLYYALVKRAAAYGVRLIYKLLPCVGF